MKYEVEFKRESWVTYNVEASSLEEAEEIAWDEMEKDGMDTGYANWSVESIEEMK